MRLLNSIRSVFTRGKHDSRNGHSDRRVAARYEGGWPSFLRSTVTTSTQSAARDVAADRVGLLRMARHWDQNSPLIHGLIERITTLIVGTGINPIPASDSSRWNKQVSKAWRTWARRPDLAGRMSWGTLLRVGVRSMLRDGDCFMVLTSDESNVPKVQLIEAHRIGDGPLTSGSRPTDIDGVLRDGIGRHIGYRLFDPETLAVRTLDGDKTVQLIILERPDQPRGVSLFASTIKTVHDLDDILTLERQAVKTLSGRVDVVKTPTGSVSAEKLVSLAPDDVPPILQDGSDYYKNMLSAESLVLRPGDDYTPVTPQRPSPAWEGFVDYLTNSVALATGIPPSVLVPGKLGGADTRKDLAAAARVIEAWQWAIADGLTIVWEFVVTSWLEDGIIGNPPKDHLAVDWQMPRGVTADAGREGRLDMDLVASGMLSLEDYFGQQGWSGREKIQQIVDEQELINELDETGQLAYRLYSKMGIAAQDRTPKQEEAVGIEPEDQPASDDSGEDAGDQARPSQRNGSGSPSPDEDEDETSTAERGT